MSTSRPFVQCALHTSKKPHAIRLLTLFAQTNSPSAAPGSAKSPSAAAGDSGTLNVEIYQQDGDYIKDIEVNDQQPPKSPSKSSSQELMFQRTQELCGLLVGYAFALQYVYFHTSHMIRSRIITDIKAPSPRYSPSTATTPL